LTERNDNQKMWEDYADKYAGFAIEYDISKATAFPECASTFSHMFPVKYYKRMLQVPLLPFIEEHFYDTLYGKKIDILEAKLKLYKQLLIKRSEYSGEEEWRVLSSTQKIGFPLVSAVYMGHKILGENEERLKESCAKKNIPLYKQVLNPVGAMRFELVE